MALSLLNFFVWKKEDARVPFIIADCIIIGVLHFFEHRAKVHKAAIKTAENAHREDDKKTSLALKKAQRDEQRRVQQQNKSGPKGPTTHMNPQINQPDKTK
ncbi:hypothetical protein MHU86_19803 [Fragilaria crotonensis]|nr:hypothetical protein MHU86_19803 [Fragilaria crotonensis]